MKKVLYFLLWGWPEGRNCWPVRRCNIITLISNLTILPTPTQLTYWGYAIVTRIAMSTLKATEELIPPTLKISDTSKHFVYHMAARKGAKVHKVASTKIGKRPIYKFFIAINGKYFPIRCMLDLGCTSFVISPEAVKVFGILVVKGKIPANA